MELSLARGGLCPQCLLLLALEVTVDGTELLDVGEAPTLTTPDPGAAPSGIASTTFSPGDIQGERYRIGSLLGRGGMGEVWRAYDLKLRQDVALKSLLTEQFGDAAALEMLRQEVRVAREVVSPNVCRVFDLQELDGQELVSMEYIDGVTLREILEERSPLGLDEAREIASQFLAGLEAVHDAGLVHRDIKPDNVMITRAGRVVVMDFGIAKGLRESKGQLAGTPAYMSPEQARGEELDARSDVYSAGVTLAEMVEPRGVRSTEDRRALLESLHRDDPELAETPWVGVLRKAVAPHRDDRFPSAAALARALEEVTLRAAGEEEGDPYPGLAFFTEAQAKFFFGRELEVEALWKRLRRAHLSAVIAPSGSGKSSFLRAGLLPVLPDDWSSILMTPGESPLESLARAIAEALDEGTDGGEGTGKSESLDEPIGRVAAWRRQHAQALLIVDQFEELFTQCGEDVQRRFAELLGRLPLETDTFVLLSMREDFLYHCQPFDWLRPIFSDLMPLGSLGGSSLRRALVQPALKCGYRFEDDSMVDEMVEEVTDERGALPLLAFAASQLWSRRDRETGLITSEAYQRIGGVAGALAQHAEATLERIGEGRIPIVRELFRNLVTAEGTRAARDREELLSVFTAPTGDSDDRRPTTGDRAAAATVLDTLIDARLLTSYETDEPSAAPRIDIIHESLLRAWPRLARWRAQDAEGAQLRDELRGQARTWDQHGRTDDYLWTGSAYLDYLAWRERYPGGLTHIEQDFCSAMTHLAERRRRRRRAVLTGAFVVLIAVLAVVGGFWRRSVSAARRAEAASLYNLARLELEEQPMNAVAYATKALELADSEVVRRLALEALWKGPTVLRLETGSPYSLDFSPDGRWMMTADESGVRLWPPDGGASKVLEGSEEAMEAFFSADGKLVGASLGSERQRLSVWSWPEGRRLYELDLGSEGLTQGFRFSPDGRQLFTSTELQPGDDDGAFLIRSWSMADGRSRFLGRLPVETANRFTIPAIDKMGSMLAWPIGDEVHVAGLQADRLDPASAAVLRHDTVVGGQMFDEQGARLATGARGNLWLWARVGDTFGFERRLEVEDPAQWRFDLSGGRLGTSSGLVWDLSAPPLAQPLQVAGGSYGIAFDPTGRWVGVGNFRQVSLSPLNRTYPRILPVGGEVSWVWFTPDGKRLAFYAEGALQIVSLVAGSDEKPRILKRTEGYFGYPQNVIMSPDGTFVATGSASGQVWVVPTDGGQARQLIGFTSNIASLAIGPAGRYIAAGAGAYNAEEAVVRLWDLMTGDSIVLDAEDGISSFLKFEDAENLLAFSGETLKRWYLGGDTPSVTREWAFESGGQPGFQVTELSPSLDRALVFRGRSLEIHELDGGGAREIVPASRGVRIAFFDRSGDAVIWGDAENIWVSPSADGEPHLLIGHVGAAFPWDVSPDGRWIASAGVDGTIRLWPMPDLSKPPLQTLPREELLANLYSLTNLRAVRNPDSTTGWDLDLAPFPGWDTLPTW